MSIARNKLYTMIEFLQDEDVLNLLEYMKTHYALTRKLSWDDIEEIEPDEWDLAMMKDMKEHPEDCQPYMSQEQLLSELGL